DGQHAARVHETNLVAGLAAHRDSANEEAYAFLHEASRAAAGAVITPDARLHEVLGEVCSRTGRVDEAEVHFERAIAASPSPIKRALLRARMADMYSFGVCWDLRLVRKHLHEGYRELGQPPLTGSASGVLLAIGKCVLSAVGRRTPF